MKHIFFVFQIPTAINKYMNKSDTLFLWGFICVVLAQWLWLEDSSL